MLTSLMQTMLSVGWVMKPEILSMDEAAREKCLLDRVLGTTLPP